MLASYYKKNVIEAGCDEAGRGCLAGAVYAAAVIFPKNYKNKFLNDSKQLSEKKRNELRKTIEQDALSYAVGIVDHKKIDEINILNASFLAMNKAVEQLAIAPEHLIIDGNQFKTKRSIPFSCIVKGDGKYLSIAAASILAKTYRDEYMQELHQQYPNYHWDKNNGYPTKKHRESIKNYGTTPFHRMSFKLLPQQLEIRF